MGRKSNAAKVLQSFPRFSTALSLHPVANAIDQYLAQHGLEPSSVRKEEGASVIWQFTIGEHFSIFLRLYRYQGDGEVYLHGECAFAIAEDGADLSSMSGVLLIENGKFPFPIRLGHSGNFLVSQLWFRAGDQLNLAGLPSLVDLLVDIAQQAREKVKALPGFVSLSIGSVSQVH